MANLSIYQHLLQPVKSVADYDREADNDQLRKLQIGAGQASLDQTERANRRADQLIQLSQGLPPGTDDAGRLSALRNGGFYNEADALDKSMIERQKGTAAVAASNATTQKTNAETGKMQHDHVVNGLRTFTQPEDARQWLADSVVSGKLPMSEATAMIKKVPTDPAGFLTWRDGMLQTLVKPDVLATTQQSAANAKLTAETSTANNTANNATSRANNSATVAATMRGQDLTKSAKDATLAAAKDKLTNKSMSPTLQKELIEQDDKANAASTTLATLKKAQQLSKTAYDGWRASERAQTRVNLPGKSKEAEATIEYDNLVGEQALSSLKSIFGGNPTEGERAILLDLQASSSKPRAVRDKILTRAIAAADKHVTLATSRAKSIREGTYLSEAPGANTDLDALMSDLMKD